MKAPHRYNLTLAVVYALFWTALAINPSDRETWLLENVLVFLGVPILVLTYRSLQLSRVSYTLLFMFFCLHAIGSHYTYSLVPYDDYSQLVLGSSLTEITGWERNHYDRFVHFCFGLMLAYPCREVFLRIANVRGFWGYYLPVMLTMSFSVLYELIEWAAAVVFGGDVGIHYLGTQGDEWDGHRDMALASIGALISMAIALSINLAIQRDFASEWQDSLRVKDQRPLGEEAIARMLNEGDAPRDPRW